MKSRVVVVKAAILAVVLGAMLFDSRRFASSAEADGPAQDGVEFFEKKIRPILSDNCYMCHSAQADKPMSGLRLDTTEGMLKGGDSGQPAIVPGRPEKSRLITAIHYTDAHLRMPPAGKLTDQQVKDLETWVAMGAPDPRKAGAAGADGAAGSANWQPYDYAEKRKFWSFQPVHQPAVPTVKEGGWARTPIDLFIQAKFQEKGLKPVTDADRRALIRRATFDLIGLPPTPDEVDAFLKDRSSNAFEKVVNRLLASPQYGERWGRHWLDVVRYADTCGDNSDFPVPSAYKYRNYVIESFNKDKPYDQFIREQLAGDLLGGKSDAERDEHIIATGYLALSRRFGSQNNENNLTVDDTIDNVGKAFLGLSVSCARCHNHKFDPIPNSDYYAIYGIFSSTRYAFPGTELFRHTNDFVPLGPATEGDKLIKWQKELSELDTKFQNLTNEKAALERKAKAEKDAKETKNAKDAPDAKAANDTKVPKEAEAVKQLKDANATKESTGDKDKTNGSNGGRDKRPGLPASNDDPKTAKPERTVTQVTAELAEVRLRISELEARPPAVEKAYAVSEGKAADAKIQIKGDPKKLGDAVPRGFLQILGGEQLPATEKGSGRLELAGWISDPKNPLTARVMVNRIWQHHFGKGIVQTPNDFGSRGKAPNHPELLDYLAARFVDSGWSVKAMHRMIMLSHVYQLSSQDHAGDSAKDVGNDFLWRFNRRRLDAEEIRDAMLAVSGTLDTTMAGAQPFPPESQWHYTQHVPFIADYETNRRSVYLLQQRIRRSRVLEVFDGADTNATTPERTINITPIQALYMMNDPFTHKMADEFAVRIGMAYSEEPRRIDYAYRLALGRPATKEEIRAGHEYIQQVLRELEQTKIAEDQRMRAALGSYLRVLLSGNEFIFVD
jgi:hypothetical protein